MINTKEALLSLILDVIELDRSIKEEDELIQDLGFDELDTIELIMALENEFAIDIDNEDAEKFITIKDIIEYLKTKNITLN